MDRGFTPKQYVGLFDARLADSEVNVMFQAAQMCTVANAAPTSIKGKSIRY
jgi:hypothetical protein